MKVTTNLHMALTSHVATCARKHIPEVPDNLTWEFVPWPTGLWLQASFTYQGKPASLDMHVTFHPPEAHWHVQTYTPGEWPHKLAEGPLTDYL